MLIKLLIIAIFLLILASLGSGLLFMLKDKGQTKRTVTALTVRIGLSVLVFLLLLLAYLGGFIQPHGLIPPGGP